MTAACPECGAPAPRGVAPGAAYACPRCSNPVLSADRPPPRADAGSGRAGPSPAAATPAAPRSRALGLALVALVVLGAAYVGVYELLTAESKRARAELERLHGADVGSAPPAGPPPDGADPAALRTWRAARAREEARDQHDDLSRRIDWFFRGMLAAFAAQIALTAVVAVRSRRGVRTRATSRGA